MKVAVLSDIHGNLRALDAVLADAERRGIGRIVNLGDILSGPLDPAGTADRLMALGLETIRGNHERQLLELPPERMGLSDAATIDRLEPRHLEWLASLPETLWLEPDLYACHGSRDSDLEYLLETVEPEGCRPAREVEITARLAAIAAPMILCGHTHLPRHVRLADGRQVVNPGSVGLPAYADDHPFAHVMETGTPHARYAVIERTAEGWTVERIAVAYDWHAAAADASAAGRDDWARALLTGRA
ncbi:putative phosphodiesterase [Novosphingobium sp. PhB165]|uniref:metallophosphoesterase family protein n=1 Tax=Novosphingobium sp. PhB165 TaxID=2485105 RepID=UPI00104E1749|nr:metallophosphoesterase family protein [Novosphingobium sp. PhB165]TCM17773.1 putative phosphodiesterase [Novosphingobium sp. PhB165]